MENPEYTEDPGDSVVSDDLWEPWLQDRDHYAIAAGEILATRDVEPTHRVIKKFRKALHCAYWTGKGPRPYARSQRSTLDHAMFETILDDGGPGAADFLVSALADGFECPPDDDCGDCCDDCRHFSRCNTLHRLFRVLAPIDVSICIRAMEGAPVNEILHIWVYCTGTSAGDRRLEYIEKMLELRCTPILPIVRRREWVRGVYSSVQTVFRYALEVGVFDKMLSMVLAYYSDSDNVPFARNCLSSIEIFDGFALGFGVEAVRRAVDGMTHKLNERISAGLIKYACISRSRKLILYTALTYASKCVITRGDRPITSHTDESIATIAEAALRAEPFNIHEEGDSAKFHAWLEARDAARIAELRFAD